MRRHSLPRLDLFPFLSVLLCTLGSLTLLLLTLTEQASRSHEMDQGNKDLDSNIAVTQAVISPASQVMSSITLLEEMWHIQQGTKYLEEDIVASHQHGQVLHRRRIALERRNSDLRAQIASWIKEANHLGERQKALAERQALLSSRLQAIQISPQPVLEKLEVIYQLLPHPAQRGSWRPPIVVEAVDNRALFVASGLTVAANEAQAAERFRQAVLQTQQALNYNDRPYILLLVRPSGFALHYLVPKWLEDSDWEIGYELVPEDWRIEGGNGPAYPPSAGGSVAASGPGTRPGQPLPEDWGTSQVAGASGEKSGRDQTDAGRTDRNQAGAPGGTAKPPSKSPAQNQVKGSGGQASVPGMSRADGAKPIPPILGNETGVATLVCRQDRVEWPTMQRGYQVLTQSAALQSLLKELDNWRTICTRAGIQPELRIQVEPAGTLLYYELASSLARHGWVWQVEWLRQGSGEPVKPSQQQIPGRDR